MNRTGSSLVFHEVTRALISLGYARNMTKQIPIMTEDG